MNQNLNKEYETNDTEENSGSNLEGTYAFDFQSSTDNVFGEEAVLQSSDIFRVSKEILEKYVLLSKFKDGLAIAKSFMSKEHGVIDTEGNIIIPLKYDYISELGVSGYFIVRDNKYRYDVIDRYNNTIIPIKYYYCLIYDNGVVYVSTKANRYGAIDLSGRIVIDIKYDRVTDYNDGAATVSLKGKWGVVTTEGKILIPVVYDDISLLENGLYRVMKDNKTGIRTKENKEVVPIKYDLIGYSVGGYSIVSCDNKYGVINNSTGVDHIQLEYSEIKYLDAGQYAVRLNKKWGIINSKGNKVIPFKYTDIRSVGEDVYAVQTIGKGWGKDTAEITWRLLDTKGNLINSNKYDFIYDFSCGLAVVEIRGKHGAINSDGDLVIYPEYDRIEQFEDGLAKVELNGRCGVINTTGTVIIPIDCDGLLESGPDELFIACLDYRLVAYDRLGNKVDLSNSYFLNNLLNRRKGHSYLYKGYINDGNGFKDNEFALLDFGDKCGVISREGKVVVPLRYDSITFLGIEGIAIAKIGRSYTAFDRQWHVVDVSDEYCEAILYKRHWTDGMTMGGMLGNMGTTLLNRGW